MTRHGWLDALRGWAAGVVVLFHLGPWLLGTETHLAIYRLLDFGRYAVLLFFLISGYVVPMSLERHGSLRRFWVGRLFRVYPAYLAAIAVLVVTTAAIPRVLREQTVAGVLGHATMLTDLLGLRGAVRPFWTLTYEMVFYLVVSGLFAWRLHRHSAPIAAALAVAAVVLPLPDGLLAATFASRRATAIGLTVVVAGVVVACLTRSRVRVAGVAGIALLGVVAVNGHPAAGSTVASSGEGLLLLATMFAGTVVHRWHQDQLGRAAGGIALAAVGAGLATTVGVLTTAAVAATFAAFFALRERPAPGFLVRLGTISYSLYVLHVVVMLAYARLVPHLTERPVQVRVLVAALCLASAVGAAVLAYRWVELPCQLIGRRLATQRAAPRTARRVNGTRSV